MSRLSLARPLVLGAILVTTTTFGCGDHTRVTAPQQAKEVGLTPVAAPEPSRLVSCTNTWKAAVSGSWADATKWSTNAVPTASDDVCITANGTYTVTVTGVRVANTVTIGATDNTANPVVNIAGTGTGSSLTAATGMVNEGTITMTWAGGTNGTVSMVAVTDGVLENRGSLQVMNDGIGAPRAIRANLVNHGSVSIATHTTFDKANAVYENRGSFTVAGGGVNMVSGLGQRFLQSGGTLAVNSGSFSVNAESFDFQGGNITGAGGVTLTGGTLIIGPDATGTALFNVRAASTLVGNIGASTLVRIIGINTGSTLTSATGFSNAGTIELLWGGGTNGTHATLAVTEGALTNTGTIRSLSDGIGSPRYIRGSVVNEGTVSIQHLTTFDKPGAIYENRGGWTVSSTMQMVAGVSQRFVQSAGVLTVTGSFVVTKERFDYDGGSIAGTVTLTDAALNIGEGSTGAATFNIRGASTLAGDIAAGQLVRIQGLNAGSSLTSATGFTNAGTIEQTWAGGTNGTNSTLAVTNGVLTNTGTIRTLTDGIGAPRTISASIVNTGSIIIDQLTTFNKPGATYDNQGTFTITRGGVNITNAAGQTFRQSGGTLTATASMVMSGGTFEVVGGTITGNPVVHDGMLRFAPGATGTGRIMVRGTAAKLAGDVPAGWSVWASTIGATSTLLHAPDGFTNYGLIELAPVGGGSNNGTGVNLTVSNGVFRNVGTLRVNNDPFGGSGRTINAELVNDGNVEIFTITTLARTNGVFRNNATLAFKANTFINMTGLGQTFITTGQVTGPGNIHLNNVTFMGSGNVAVNLGFTNVNAHIGTAGAATLNVTGNYTMATGGSLNVDLSNDPTPGTGHDRLTVSGRATLLGTLNVTPIAGSCIDPSQTFEIMGFSSRVGDFSTKNGLNLGGGRTLTAQANATNYRLISNGTPCVAPDDTPPVITPTVVGTLGNNDWYTSDVTISWNVTDAESPVTSSEGCGSTTLTTDNAGITYTCSATSNGGSASRSVTVKRDATAPVGKAVRTPAANEHGWNNMDVYAQYSASDAMSGMAGAGFVQVTFSNEGANQQGSHTFADNAGNTATVTVTGISIDKTAPTWYESRRIPALPASGWYNTPVFSELTGSDALSGLANLAVVSHTTSNEGRNVGWQNGFADKAGNGVLAEVLLNIDMTPPVVTVTRSPLPDASGWNNTNVTVTYSATDALSGVAGATTFQQLFDQDGANQSGSHSFTDVAGNSATGTVSGINIDRSTLEVSCSATPEEIWPANNKMVPVRVTISGTGIVRYALRSVTNNETGAADAAGWAIGTADLEGTVMASRLGQGSGRTYTLTYDVFGSRGSSTCSTTVRVPHDRRK